MYSRAREAEKKKIRKERQLLQKCFIFVYEWEYQILELR